MKVYLNHNEIECADGITLLALLESQNIKTDGVAAAVNNRVVPKPDWASHVLESEAKVTVIRAVCGG